MDAFIDHSEVMAEMMDEGKMLYLRKYAATNQDEFFAVCIENFFEMPNELRIALPNTYRKLSRMLNQYPAGIN